MIEHTHTHTQTREQEEEEKWLKATDKSRLKNRQRQLQKQTTTAGVNVAEGKAQIGTDKQAVTQQLTETNQREKQHTNTFSVCVLAVQLSKQPARKKVCC